MAIDSAVTRSLRDGIRGLIVEKSTQGKEARSSSSRCASLSAKPLVPFVESLGDPIDFAAEPVDFSVELVELVEDLYGVALALRGRCNRGLRGGWSIHRSAPTPTARTI